MFNQKHFGLVNQITIFGEGYKMKIVCPQLLSSDLQFIVQVEHIVLHATTQMGISFT